MLNGSEPSEDDELGVSAFALSTSLEPGIDGEASWMGK